MARPTSLAVAWGAGQARPFNHVESSMSGQETILQIMPATGWVAVYEDDGEESAQTIICFALVESVENGVQRRAVRPMSTDGKQIGFADVVPNFVRVEELAEFEEDEEDEEEDEEEEVEE